MSAVIAELRRGPRTTSQLTEATGLTKNAVQIAVRKANDRGYSIVNVRRRGGQHEGLYWLEHDHDRPGVRHCSAPGCGTVLSPSNGTKWCRSHLPGVALMLYVEQLLAEAMEEVPDDQLCLTV